MSSALPAAYCWFLLRGLTDWTPWRLQDDSSAVKAPTNFERSKYFQHQCKIETGADFDFYLFARRQDREELPSSSAGLMVEWRIQPSRYTSRSADG